MIVLNESTPHDIPVPICLFEDSFSEHDSHLIFMDCNSEFILQKKKEIFCYFFM